MHESFSWEHVLFALYSQNNSLSSQYELHRLEEREAEDNDGATAGIAVGLVVGPSVGMLVGPSVVIIDGMSDGILVGISVGMFVGLLVGIGEGAAVDTCSGSGGVQHD